MKRIHIKPLLVACLLIVLTGCVIKPIISQASEPLKSLKVIPEPVFSRSFKGTQDLLDYAARLEAAGNPEAAAAVYARLGKAAQRELDATVEEILASDALRELRFLTEISYEDLSLANREQGKG